MEVLGQNSQEYPLKHGIVIYILGTAQMSYKTKQKNLVLSKCIILCMAAFLDVLGHRWSSAVCRLCSYLFGLRYKFENYQHIDVKQS